jgi:hypothetical protein
MSRILQSLLIVLDDRVTAMVEIVGQFSTVSPPSKCNFICSFVFVARDKRLASLLHSARVVAFAAAMFIQQPAVMPVRPELIANIEYAKQITRR